MLKTGGRKYGHGNNPQVLDAKSAALAKVMKSGK